MSTHGSSIPAVPSILALAVRPLPLLPLQPLLALCVGSVLRRHPRIFDRLGEHADKRYGIDPTDLPFAFVLEPRPGAARARAVRTLPEGLNARIAGPLAALMGLADGTYDGDALFFSRDLTISGDVEAVLALRNALDDARVDFIELAASNLGPFAPAALTVMRRAERLFRPAEKTGPVYQREATPWN